MPRRAIGYPAARDSVSFGLPQALVPARPLTKSSLDQAYG